MLTSRDLPVGGSHAIRAAFNESIAVADFAPACDIRATGLHVLTISILWHFLTMLRTTTLTKPDVFSTWHHCAHNR